MFYGQVLFRSLDFEREELKKLSYVAIMLNDMKMQPTLTLATGNSSVVCQHFQRPFPADTVRPFKLFFICSLSQRRKESL